MSLLHLVHKNIVIRFADAANTKFNPDASYAFRLTGVDGMGFIQVRDLAAAGQAGPEPTSEAYWINKDLIRELHEFDLIKSKETLTYTGVVIKPPSESVVPDAAYKSSKTKMPAKKSVLKQKPILN
jgi:hypothetical protein